MGFFNIGKKFHTCSIHNYTGTGECPDCISAYYKMKGFIDAFEWIKNHSVIKDKNGEIIDDAYIDVGDILLSDYLNR